MGPGHEMVVPFVFEVNLITGLRPGQQITQNNTGYGLPAWTPIGFVHRSMTADFFLAPHDQTASVTQLTPLVR